MKLIRNAILRTIGGVWLSFSSSNLLHAQAVTWRATWAASQTPPLPVGSATPRSAETSVRLDETQTIRDIVHVSAGGDRCRLRISNVFGKTPLLISSTHVALQDEKSSILPDTDRIATFGQQREISIPPGADMLTDPISIHIPENVNLAVSLTTKGQRVIDTVHFYALQTSYTAPGDQAAAVEMHDVTPVSIWPFLSEVQVSGDGADEGTLVAFGDSITDGAHSTPEKNLRWPNQLFERFEATGLNLAVTDAGIAGNRLLHDGQGPYATVFGPNALARFDRDVLSQAGIRYLVVLLGINDIGQPGSGGVPTNSAVTSSDIEVALSQLAARAHVRGIGILIATLLPFGGASAQGYFSLQKEHMREEVNEWIRKSSEFDGIADFDKALRDPVDKTRMRPTYDGGDHLHPNDAGAKAMADSIPLNLFSALK